MKNNKLPEYVIEELIPRFRGIDAPTIANVKCDQLGIDGNYIMSKTSEPDYDKLHLNADDTMMGTYDIVLCSDKAYREIKELYEDSKGLRCDETDGMLSTYHHSITTGLTYVTSIGFENHFKIRTLSKDFGIDIKKNYKFSKSKLKINDVFKISYKGWFDDDMYGILIKIEDETLCFKFAQYSDLYECDIDWIIDGKIEIKRVVL